MIQPREINMHDIIKELVTIVDFFRNEFIESVKANDKPSPALLMYAPEELEQITISIAHFDYVMRTFPKNYKDDDALKDWALRNKSFLAYMRDMMLSWYHRIEHETADA